MSQINTAPFATTTIVESPMVKIPSDRHPGILMRLDPQRLSQLSLLQHVELQNVSLPSLGEVRLELDRLPLPIADDSMLRIDNEVIPGGVRAHLPPNFQIWRGAVEDIPGSRVFLALSEESAQGFIENPNLAERYVHFTTEGNGLVRVVEQAQLTRVGLKRPKNFCTIDAQQGSAQRPGAVPPAPNQLKVLPDETAANVMMMNQTVNLLRLAVETDTQLEDLLGSSSAVTNYVTGLIGAVSDQYLVDVKTVIEIAYLGIHTTTDTWDEQDMPGGDVGDLLYDEFIPAWAPNNWPVQADLAHFISGADLGGGIANFCPTGICPPPTRRCPNGLCPGVLCDQNEGFAASSNINGNLNWDTWTGEASNFTWDFIVVAHELGHNFGARHTHDYGGPYSGDPQNPCIDGLLPLDICWNNCTPNEACSRGTIMSYCYLLCDGGITGNGLALMDLYFHPTQAGYMRDNVAGSCLGVAHTVTTVAPNSSPRFPPKPL